jgi:thiol-disulfide isomerase/thioredoxin
MKARRLLPAMVIGALLLVLGGCGTVQFEDESRVGSKAPEFTLPDLDGRPVSLSKYQGKVVILDFWASWCAPCVAELPVFQDLQEKYGDKGFAMLGVNVSDENPDVASFLRSKSIRYTNLVGDQRIQDLYGPISGFPTTFIIDRDGTIRQHFVGGRPREVIEGAITSLL